MNVMKPQIKSLDRIDNVIYVVTDAHAIQLKHDTNVSAMITYFELYKLTQFTYVN